MITLFFGCLLLLLIVGAQSIEDLIEQSTESEEDFQTNEDPIHGQLRGKSQNLTNLPIGLQHQSKEEENYLKLHKCKDGGEAYSAAYLMTREHLLQQRTGELAALTEQSIDSTLRML